MGYSSTDAQQQQQPAAPQACPGPDHTALDHQGSFAGWQQQHQQQTSQQTPAHQGHQGHGPSGLAVPRVVPRRSTLQELQELLLQEPRGPSPGLPDGGGLLPYVLPHHVVPYGEEDFFDPYTAPDVRAAFQHAPVLLEWVAGGACGTAHVPCGWGPRRVAIPHAVLKALC